MTELTPVGLSKDGKRLVLISAQGEEYAVRVDHRLRSALQGDQARLGQLEMTMESTLRPRDIQNRIRAGESAEAVADAAGSSVDKIMTFAGPVLAERAHVAESALSSSVRRRSADSSSSSARTLAEAAAGHLRSVGVRHDEDVEWDAWRRDDGRWTLVADYTGNDGPRHAEFTYDMPGRYVTAEDDEARLLTGEMTAVVTNEPASGGGGRRLTAVPSQDELPLGDDAIELVRDRADADWIAQAPTSESPAEPEPEELVDGAAPVDEPVEEHTAPIKKKSRSSVPSWDEIMFGGGKPE